MNLFEIALSIERSDDFHLARLLLILRAVDEVHPDKPVEGATKLANLDFLVRYPSALERALKESGYSVGPAEVAPEERANVESHMIQHRWGPWDKRYRRWINLLVGRGLASARLDGKAISVNITPRGREVATRLSASPDFEIINKRALIVAQRFPQTAKGLRKFTMEKFPELSSMRVGEEIRL